MHFLLKFLHALSDIQCVAAWDLRQGNRGNRGISMRIIRDQSMLTILGGVHRAESGLAKAMSRASSGQKLQTPGDGPTEFGISEQLRYQIRNSGEAVASIQNARNLVGSTDAWLQVTHDILGRMQELSIASSDASKSQQDREVLNNEFLQLKEEIGRIASDARYNGIPVAGRDQMITYNGDLERFQLSFLDGSDAYTLDKVFISGVDAANGHDLNFDPSNEYMLSKDGQYIYYVDSNELLSRYEIETGVLTRDAASGAEEKQLDIDETGRLWYASETTAGSGVYQLREQDRLTWTQYTGNIGDGDIADLSSPEFQVYQDRIYYVDTSSNLVSRSLGNLADVRVEVDGSETSFSTAPGQFAIAEDGQFMADLTSPGVLRVTNLESGRHGSYDFGSDVDIQDLQFSVDNREMVFTNATDGSIHRISLDTSEETPVLSGDEKVHLSTGSTGYQGLNVGGGSHRANIRVQNGPNAEESIFITGGDVRLFTLGLSRVDISSAEGADQALGLLQKATDQVSVQRARLGAEESRLDYARQALERYISSLNEVDSFLRDADIAEESAEIAQQQVRYQASIALVAQAPERQRALVQLLQG